MTKIEDIEIVEELKKDSKEGTELLFKEYYPRLINYGKKYYKNISDEDIEEIADDTIITAYQNISKFEFENGKGFNAWIFNIFKNKITDLYKKKKLTISHFDECEESDESDKNEILSTNKEIYKISYDLFFKSEIIEDERKNIIYETFNEFTSEEQEDLWAYFNNIPHKESALYRDMKEPAYRKRISRLTEQFFLKIGEKLNKDGKQIHEEFKKQNR